MIILLFHYLDGEIRGIKGISLITVEMLFLGLALATDAAIVSFALGLLSRDESMRGKWQRGFVACLLFGFMQFFMLLMGSYGGFWLSFSEFGYLFHLVVASIFVGLALKCFQESLSVDRKAPVWGLWPLFVLSLVTSLDALGAGMSLGTLPNAYWMASEVGIITFAMCSLFYTLAHFFNELPQKWLLRAAGCILLGLGGSIILDYV